MAVLRYIIMKWAGRRSSFPLKADSASATLLAIGVALVISLLGSIPNMLRYRITDRGSRPIPTYCTDNISSYSQHYLTDRSRIVHAYSLARPDWWSCTWERINFWIAGLLLKLIPCMILTVFMTLLVRMLIEARSRRNRLLVNRQNSSSLVNVANTTTTSSTSSAAERTTTMLILIVLIFWICELPQGVFVLASGMQPTLLFAMSHFNELIDLLSLINSSFNFILYCAMSAQFRQQFLLMFGGAYDCCRSSKTLSTTTTTAIATTRTVVTNTRNGCAQQEMIVTIDADPNGHITPI